MSTLATDNQQETILYTPINPAANDSPPQTRHVTWYNNKAANNATPTSLTPSTTSGIFTFAADDPDFVDENGHVLLTKVFNHNATTGAPLTPEQRKEHLQNGLTKKWHALDLESNHQVTTILHASGSTVKVEELRQALQQHDLKIRLIGSALGYTVEDSKETQENGAEITQDKINTSIEKEVAKLKPSEMQEVFTGLDVNNFDSTIGISDDRSVLLDPVLRESSVWDDIRDSSIPEVKEAFQNYHDFPGKRMKEVMKACGGAINFVDRLHAAHKELQSKGIETNKDVSFGVWVFAKPLAADKTALPNAGAYFYQQMNGAQFINVTETDRAAAQEGKTFDVDHFVVAAQHQGMTDKNGRPFTLANLRNTKNNYYAEDHPIAQIMHKITDLLQTPLLDEPQNWDPVRITNPKATATGGHKSHISKTKKLRKKHYPGKKGALRHLSPEKNISSIKDIEKISFKSDAIIIPPQDYSNMPPLEALLLKLLRRSVVDLHLALYHAGSYVASGCPLIIAKDALNEHKHHASFYNSGASATHFMDVVKTYDGTAASLARTLNSPIWDQEAYKPHEKRKKLTYDYITEEELCQKVGINDIEELGIRVAVLGGATTELPAALKQTEDMAYEAAKRGVTLFHGGGSRGVMGAIMQGAIRAYKEGYRDFKQIAIRTPIVSAAEGSMTEFIKKNGLDISAGDLDSDYYSFMEGHIHVIEKEAFCVRQDGILRFTPYGIVLPGGHGTASEDDQMNINNIKVKLEGRDFFNRITNYRRYREHLRKKSGTKSSINLNSVLLEQTNDGHIIIDDGTPDKGIIYKALINIEGYFDPYIETLTPEEQKLTEQTIFENATQALMQFIEKAEKKQQNIQKQSITSQQRFNTPGL